MCGIVSLFSRKGPIDAASLARGTARLHHRGPDARGHWIAPSGAVGLGHARLSVIDLVTGDQPIANEDATLHAVVNGEIYDHDRIRDELCARGHVMRTRTDSEIVLHLYEELGTGCMRELRGELAFVLWDEANQQLVAARDRFGIKPLHYAWAGDTLYLASEAKALFAAGVPARWNDQAVFDYLHTSDASSLFDGVQQIPPGCMLIASRSRFDIVRYWDLDYPRRDAAAVVDAPQLIERTRSLLIESVRLRMRADVEVGCYLSGGIDSATVIGIASRLAAEPITAYTLAFEDPSYDELDVARRTAALVGARAHPVPITEAMLADHFSDAFCHAELPAGNLHCVAMHVLSETVQRAGHKVVLTGEGADEVFAGYAHLRRDAILAGAQDHGERARRLAELSETHARLRFGLPLPEAGDAEIASVRALLGFVPSFLQGRAAYAAPLRQLFTAELAERFAHRDPYRVFLGRFDVDGQLRGREPVHQAMYLWTKSGLHSYLLGALGDRMQMAHGIEARLPMLDHVLFELVRGAPLDLKIRNGTEKYLLREAARPFITDEVYGRPKKPFVVPPFARDTRGPLGELMRDVLASRAFAAQPFFDHARVSELLARAPLMDDAAWRAASEALTMVLAVAVLQDRFALS